MDASTVRDEIPSGCEIAGKLDPGCLVNILQKYFVELGVASGVHVRTNCKDLVVLEMDFRRPDAGDGCRAPERVAAHSGLLSALGRSGQAWMERNSIYDDYLNAVFFLQGKYLDDDDLIDRVWWTGGLFAIDFSEDCARCWPEKIQAKL